MTAWVRRWWLAGLAACGAADTPTESQDGPPAGSCGNFAAFVAEHDIQFELEVECTGMNASWLGYTQARSVAQLVSEDRDLRGLAACELLLYEPVAPERVTLAAGDTFGQPGSAVLTLQQAGGEWVAYDGCMALDRYELASPNFSSQAAGHYEAILAERIAGTVDGWTGNYAHAWGPISWCAYGQDPACPARPEETSLAQEVGVRFGCEDGYCNLDQTGRSANCRALINPANHGMVVELELGYWRGQPITAFTAPCDWGGQQGEVMPNRFTFRADGVTGPGTYGPVSSAFVGPAQEHRVPSLSFRYPAVWDVYDTFGFPAGCMVGAQGQTTAIEAVDGTSCSFTLAEQPGRFSVDCVNALYTPGVVGLGAGSGAFHLETDCDVRYLD